MLRWARLGAMWEHGVYLCSNLLLAAERIYIHTYKDGPPSDFGKSKHLLGKVIPKYKNILQEQLQCETGTFGLALASMNRSFKSLKEGGGLFLVWMDVSPGQSCLTGLSESKAIWLPSPYPSQTCNPREECEWALQRWLFCYAALSPSQIHVCLLVSNHLDISLMQLVTNTTGQWPSDIKWSSAIRSFLSHRKSKERMEEGGEKRKKKREREKKIQ